MKELMIIGIIVMAICYWLKLKIKATDEFYGFDLHVSIEVPDYLHYDFWKHRIKNILGRVLSILLGILTLMCLGCDKQKNEKPFIVVDKDKNHNVNQWRFTYEDKNGNEHSFYEDKDIYKIGDTIK